MMKSFEELSYYELLDVAHDASQDELQRAYENVVAIIDQDSLIGYTLLDSASQGRYRDRVQQAYQTLMDPLSRRDYDRALARQTVPDEGTTASSSSREARTVREEPDRDPGRALFMADAMGGASESASTKRVEAKPAARATSASAPQTTVTPRVGPTPSGPTHGGVTSQHRPTESSSIAKAVPQTPAKMEPTPAKGTPSATLDARLKDPATVFDGPTLKSIRQSLTISVDEIAELTKIGKHHLLCIEEHRYAELPAPVYLRGFLKQYAQYLGLDVNRVVESYMAAYKKGTAATRF